MATNHSGPESATTSPLIEELSRSLLGKDEKQATTLRLKRSTLRRLKAMEKKWETSMSLITERALAPVLDELEAAALPDADADGDEE